MVTESPETLPRESDTQAAARAVDLTKTYGSGESSVHALRGVNFAAGRGKFTAVMGPSGSGKSTLLHCLAGLDRPTSGQVYIGEIELTALKDKHLTKLRRDRVGFVFQAYNLLPTLTAAENIRLPLAIARSKADEAWIAEILAVLALSDRLGHRPAELSGGEQQRVAAARALAHRPEVVFADEPTGNLDSKSGSQLLDFIRRSVDEFGQTMVMVSHDPHAASRADRVVFLADGRIVDEMPSPTFEAVLDRLKSLGV